MNNVHERLLSYRKTKEQRSLAAKKLIDKNEENYYELNNDQAISNNDDVGASSKREQKFYFYDYLAIDLLNFYPMRKWREFCSAFPLQCWICTGCIWFAGQIVFVTIEFGLVYFIMSLFILMFLNLGVRREGEMSAYSVFNPNCERLLGQMTSEHFERDMLMTNRANAN